MQYYAKIKKQKDTKYLVVFPDLDGCFTEGDSLAEAKIHAAEALNLWLSFRPVKQVMPTQFLNHVARTVLITTP